MEYPLRDGLSEESHNSSPSQDAVSTFFLTSSPPRDLQEIHRSVRSFCEKSRASGRRVVCVTSGGTTVPLEKNTVRFLTNFSSGTRGAVSTEYFIRHGYCVVFLHRRFSIQPFHRHFLNEGETLLDLLEIDSNNSAHVCVREDAQDKIFTRTIEQYSQCMKEGTLLKISFETVFDYLFYLREIALIFEDILGPSSMFFLAAAVSDFYVPESKMPEHKIQSVDGPPPIYLSEVPKMLGSLSNLWCPSGMIVSFKLETDPDLLLAKAVRSLNEYSVAAVVANLLSSHRQRVIVVFPQPSQLSISSSLDFSETHPEIVERVLDINDHPNSELDELLVLELIHLHACRQHEVSTCCSSNDV